MENEIKALHISADALMACNLRQKALWDEAYQAGLRRASEILLNEYDRAMSHGGQTFELYLDLETALSEEIKK